MTERQLCEGDLVHRMDLLLQRTLDNSYIHIFMHSICVIKHCHTGDICVQSETTQCETTFRAKPPGNFVDWDAHATIFREKGLGISKVFTFTARLPDISTICQRSLYRNGLGSSALGVKKPV